MPVSQMLISQMLISQMPVSQMHVSQMLISQMPVGQMEFDTVIATQLRNIWYHLTVDKLLKTTLRKQVIKKLN
jgi:hypothetical protein